ACRRQRACTRPAVRRLPAAQPLPMPIQEPSNIDGASLSLRVIPRDGHPISRNDISPNALRVLYRLRDAGFGAYLVGGAVRDLLVEINPKDCYVSPDATPD